MEGIDTCWSWYVKGQKGAKGPKAIKNIKERLYKLGNEQEQKIFFTYSKTTQLLYCIQSNKFFTKKEMENYEEERTRNTIKNKGYTKANFRYLRIDQDLLEFRNGKKLYSVREDREMTINEMNNVKENISRKKY